MNNKILNNLICRLCLSEEYEKLIKLSDDSDESLFMPSFLIEKFNLVQVNK